MQAIVCVTQNWGIGKNNELLFHLHEDLRRFRRLTVGNTVIMGYNTLLSMPGGKPLPNRESIILCDDPAVTVPGCVMCRSIPEVLTAARSLPPDRVFVCGGASVYEQLLPYCERVLVTRVAAAPDADRFFPDLDRQPEWSVERESELLEEAGIRFQYVDYVNRSPEQ